MSIFKGILLVFLIVCAISVSVSKNLLTSIVIYMSYSLIMCIIWIILESPDLAITEAAVGAGVTSVLFFVTLKKIQEMKDGYKAGRPQEKTEENIAEITERAKKPQWEKWKEKKGRSGQDGKGKNL